MTRIAATRPARRRSRLLGVAGAASVAALAIASPAMAASYTYYDSDNITTQTPQAWIVSANRAYYGQVDWHKAALSYQLDNFRGSLRNAYLTPKANYGRLPQCIAARVTWEGIGGSLSVGTDAIGYQAGISRDTQGWYSTCVPGQRFNLSGMAYSSRRLMSVKIEVCSRASYTSAWACATERNLIGGR